MTAGDSRAELTINRQPALAPSPQPRPAPTARALPSEPVARGGQSWTPIDTSVTLLARARNHMRPPAEYKRLMIGLEPERLVIAFQARDIDKRARPDLAGHDLAGSDQPG